MLRKKHYTAELLAAFVITRKKISENIGEISFKSMKCFCLTCVLMCDGISSAMPVQSIAVITQSLAKFKLYFNVGHQLQCRGIWSSWLTQGSLHITQLAWLDWDVDGSPVAETPQWSAAVDTAAYCHTMFWKNRLGEPELAHLCRMVFYSSLWANCSVHFVPHSVHPGVELYFLPLL